MKDEDRSFYMIFGRRKNVQKPELHQKKNTSMQPIPAGLKCVPSPEHAPYIPTAQNLHDRQE